ncbi:hypothetical protein [Mycobacterium innocens]|nr:MULTISPECIES: hypothetical protein [Mycobacterium]
MNDPAAVACPRCGAFLPADFGPRRGRRRIWCSDRCRRDAHAERVAAARTHQPIRVVEVPRTAPPLIRPVVITLPRDDLTPAEVAARVLASPTAMGYVLDSLTRQAREKTLDKKVRNAALSLAKTLLPGQRRY